MYERRIIVRLDSNGIENKSYPTLKADENESVHSIIIEEDGNIIIGGEFSSYGSFKANSVARIYGGSRNVNSIQDLTSIEDEISVYPNPTESHINIDFKGNSYNKTISARLTSIDGKPILTTNGLVEQVKDELNSKIFEVPPGIYLLYFIVDANTQMIKIVKNNSYHK